MARFPNLSYGNVSVIDIRIHSFSHIVTSIPVLRELLHDASPLPPRMLMRANSNVSVPYMCSKCLFCVKNIFNETVNALFGKSMIC